MLIQLYIDSERTITTVTTVSTAALSVATIAASRLCSFSDSLLVVLVLGISGFGLTLRRWALGQAYREFTGGYENEQIKKIS